MGVRRLTLGSIIHWKDEWEPGKAVKKHGVVSHDGSTFIAVRDNPTAEPIATYSHGKWNVSDGWALVAFGAGADNEKAVVDGHRVIAQAIAQILGDVEALKSQVGEGGDFHASAIDSDSLPTVAGEEFNSKGAGAPSVAPKIPFSEYWDSENNKFYKAKGTLSNSVSDWVPLN